MHKLVRSHKLEAVNSKVPHKFVIRHDGIVLVNLYVIDKIQGGVSGHPDA